MNASERHLLIDGYNVIYDWPELRKELGRGGGAMARDRLVGMVRVIHDVEGCRLTVVFDGKGSRVEIERPGRELTFSVLYSPEGMSADEVIEQLVGSSGNPEQFQVVTRDSLERQTVEAFGASGLSPADLLDWIDRCQKRLGADVSHLRGNVDGAWRRKSKNLKSET
ncbi:MAG: NYN domain-containing protein [Opitutales bacterium]